jgi:hypothetical protein
MVLLASPGAAASTWVANELGAWLQVHSMSRLMLVLVRGIIEWDPVVHDFDWGRTDALPRVLTHHFDGPPRIVDLRGLNPESASLKHLEFRNAMVRLVETIAETPPAELSGTWQRASTIRSLLSTSLLVISDAMSVTTDAASLAYGGLARWLRTAAGWRNPLRRQRLGPHLPPGAVVDDVHFTLTSPLRLRPQTSAEIIFWCHFASEHAAVLRRAVLMLGRKRREIAVKSEGPVEVARGTTLTVNLGIQGLLMEPGAKTVLWKGRTGNATFVATAPSDCVQGARKGTASIRVDDVEIARLDFVLTVSGARTLGRPQQHRSVVRHRTAFASYANEDRAEVLKRVHPHAPSQTWRTFLTNHTSQILAADLFVVPTVTFRLLSCWSSSSTTVDGSSMWPAPIIRREPRSLNSFGTPSLKTRRPAISCTIAMARLPRSRPPSLA